MGPTLILYLIIRIRTLLAGARMVGRGRRDREQQGAGRIRIGYKPKLLDIGSTITIGLTLILFGVSVAEKGLSHELLQDAAVFLVSVKLIISMAQVFPDPERNESAPVRD